MTSSAYSKALIIGPAWVGDMVMAHTLVQLLAREFAEIHIAAPSATLALGERMAEVSTTHLLDFGHGALKLAKRREVGRSLMAQGYAASYVLPNSWKSALIPFFAKVPRRVGWHGEARFGLLNDRRKLNDRHKLNDRRKPNKETYPLMIERFMALADARGNLPATPYLLPKLEADPDNRAHLLAHLNLDASNAVALCPGAEFGAAKKWPAEHYAAVATDLLAQGKSVWLMGSPKDAQDCQRIAKLAPGAVDLAGRTQLLDALDLISACQHVVCNDSGLMHVACALAVPTVGIFGSTSPDFTPPLGDQATVAQLEMDCRPCFQRECPLGHLNCLRQLQPDQVLAKLAR